MYDDIVKKASETYGVDEKIIKGIIETESSWNANATGKAGEKGLMQLMPSTAVGLGIKNPYDPEENIMGGTRYLSLMLENNGGDIDRALSAYNQGQGNLNKYGITNQSYVEKVKGSMSAYEESSESTVIVETEEEKNKARLNLFGNIIKVVLCIIIFLLGVIILLMSVTGGTINPKKIALNTVAKKVTGSNSSKGSEN